MIFRVGTDTHALSEPSNDNFVPQINGDNESNGRYYENGSDTKIYGMHEIIFTRLIYRHDLEGFCCTVSETFDLNFTIFHTRSLHRLFKKT